MNFDGKDRDQIILENVGLVHHTLRRHFPGIRKQDYDDCVSVGMIALIRAVDRFDDTKGVEFSTYVCKSVYLEVRRYLNKNRAVNIPEHVICKRVKNGEEVDTNTYIHVDTLPNETIQMEYNEDFTVAETNMIIDEIANGNADIKLNINLTIQGYSNREISEVTHWNCPSAVRMARTNAIEKYKNKINAKE